jgi:hypothetical protein
MKQCRKSALSLIKLSLTLGRFTLKLLQIDFDSTLWVAWFGLQLLQMLHAWANSIMCILRKLQLPPCLPQLQLSLFHLTLQLLQLLLQIMEEISCCTLLCLRSAQTG